MIKKGIFETSDNDEKKTTEGTLDKGSVTEKKVALEAPEELGDQKELTDDQTARQKARQEIEKMDLDDSLKAQTQSSVDDVKSLEDQKKIEHLLGIAKAKGVIFAVTVAKKMDDPFVLDAFHDALVKNGYYKEFLRE